MSYRFSLAELVDEAERECQMRARVYARSVSDGKMTRDTADRKIAMMSEIATRLREALPPPPQGDLLDG